MILQSTDKLSVLARSLAQAINMPSLRHMVAHLLCPVDSTRFTEFAYLLRYIKENKLQFGQILDVSSPFQLAYLLSRSSKVLKTDINAYERTRIRQQKNLSFQKEDATHLTFADNTFDLVYSISVIEHIYNGSRKAIQEMLRVVRPGGYLYVTFPVADQPTEEWLDNNVYSDQYANNGKVFFQYRFGEIQMLNLLNELKNVELVNCSIYWERGTGQYDRIMGLLRKPVRPKPLLELRKGLINLWAGFTLLEDKPASFGRGKKFGNASVLLKKSNYLND